MNLPILNDRKKQIYEKGRKPFEIICGKHSLAGSISQRACVFCGSRVVLYPIADALHLIHGPIGCAAYTWDIRGAFSSGPILHRLSFSTDISETDVIFGGEQKLYNALIELINAHHPKAAFVYSTCIVGIIGDDVDAVCQKVETETGIPVLPVHSEGFRGTKKDGYRAACEALFKLVGTNDSRDISPTSINIIGEFNIGGEAWMIRNYYEQMGVQVVAILTGDGRVDDVRISHRAALNVVQCSGAMTYLAEMMRDKYSIPYTRVSYVGIEDTAKALYTVAERFVDHPEIFEKTKALVRNEIGSVYPIIEELKKDLVGKRAAIYVGGAFKALSLVKALKLLGMQTVLVGTQTGDSTDYETLESNTNVYPLEERLSTN